MVRSKPISTFGLSTYRLSIKVRRPRILFPQEHCSKWTKNNASWNLNCRVQQEHDKLTNTNQQTTDASTTTRSTLEGQEVKIISKQRKTKTDGQPTELTKDNSKCPNQWTTAISAMREQHLFTTGPHLSFRRSLQGVSCPHAENLRYLHILKLTVCFICMKPSSLRKSYCNFCCQECIDL